MADNRMATFWELVNTASRDHRLNAWERNFLRGLREQVETRNQPWLSEAQSLALAKIAVKLGFPLPRPVQELMERSEQDLLAFATEARGDPRLTSWEEGFLASVSQQRRPLSGKQRAILKQLADKLAAPPAPLPDDVDAEPEAEPADAYEDACA